MDQLKFNDKENQILKRYDYQVSDVDEVTPKMWKEICDLYKENLTLTFEDFKDLNIVKIAFIKGTTYEIQSIGGSASRMMVLPLKDQVQGVFKNLLHEITLH